MIPGPHMLGNALATTPLHLLAAAVPSTTGSRWQYLTAPFGIYSSLKAGHHMDENRLSTADALAQAGLLGFNLSHVGYNLSGKPEEYIMKKLQKRFPGSSPTTTLARGLGLTAGTLGIGLPLYFYYRQGLKPEEKADAIYERGLR